MQLLSNVAMEPPIGAGAEALRDERTKVLKGVQCLEPSEVVRGQFDGYLQRAGREAELAGGDLCGAEGLHQ